AFNFIGSAAFSAAGQLRAQIDVINNVTIIQGNTNANTGTVEFELRLSGQHSLFTGDFIPSRRWGSASPRRRKARPDRMPCGGRRVSTGAEAGRAGKHWSVCRSTDLHYRSVLEGNSIGLR